MRRRASVSLPFLLAVAAAGCGSSSGPSPSADAGGGVDAADAAAVDAADGGGIDTGAGPQIGPMVMLPLRDPVGATVFNQSAETTIAAHDGTVVVAYISMAFDQADSFQTVDVIRGGSLATSHDSGGSFGAAVAMGGDQPTDPVVRVGAGGTFFAASWDWATESTTTVGTLQRSTDGDHWDTVASSVSTGDKEWIAVDDAGQRVFWGGLSAYHLFGFDGSPLADSTSNPAQMTNALVRGGGALFVTLGYQLALWDGSSTSTVALGPVLQPAVTGTTVIVEGGTGLGATADGTSVWLLRTVLDANGIPQVVLRVWDGDVSGGAGDDVLLSPVGSYAFMPAAALDGSGRVQAAWYQDGALVWTHSLTSNLADGFAPVTVVDASACPATFIPGLDISSGARRLREYIDVATDGPRVHIAWTHAPVAPSRVYTATIRM